MSKVRVVIQCRLSSSRLPAKALLPICGIPIVVLCAMRAKNSGLDILVTTSTDQSDDILCKTLSAANLPFFRGPLEDVLERYRIATQGLTENDIVVRLTADNIFPDGKFIEELIYVFLKNKLSYLGTNSPLNGLPYGLSAEAFTVKTLRLAAKNASSEFERENVTPWIKNNFFSEPFKPTLIKKNMSHLRCTIDTFDDYIRLNKVFDGIEDPINISYKFLCDKLFALKDAASLRVPFNMKNKTLIGTMTLGTAQLGMRYGRTNIMGKPGKHDAIQIIKESINHGITSIDTARAYGESELVIGLALNGGLERQVSVITKLSIPKLNERKFINGDLCESMVDASIFRSCRDLQTSVLNVVLLHNWEHRYACDQTIWKRLLSLKSEGIIQALGASVYTPQEASDALNDPDIKYLQIPFNILDWRWRCSSFIKKIESRPDVNIYTRSVFLQGILCSEPSFWPSFKNVNANKNINKMDELVRMFKRSSRADLCIAYVRSQPWIDSIVIGIDNLEHLRENVALFQRSILTQEQCKLLEAWFEDTPEAFLNPSNWENNEKQI